MSPISCDKSIPPVNKDFSDVKICKLSVFALICASVSLILCGFNYYGDNRALLKDNLEIKEYVHRMEKEFRDQVFKFKTEFGDKKSHRKRRNAMLTTSSIQEENTVAPSVESFNTKMKAELEEQDAAEMKETGAIGAAPGGDDWVWLTNNTKVPFNVVQGFCMAIKDYCPHGVEGPKGPPGQPGPKGERGDSGFPGALGFNGVPGARGPKGERGDSGFPGAPGFNGMPGVRGLKGERGDVGYPGAPGFNGPKGMPGAKGPNGERGDVAYSGILGMMGEKEPTGPPGANGTLEES